MANAFQFPNLQGVNPYLGQATHGANPGDNFGTQFYDYQRGLRAIQDPHIRVKAWRDFTELPSYLCSFEALLGSDTYCGTGEAWQIAYMDGQTDVVGFANTSAVVLAVGATAALPLGSNYFTASGHIIPQVGGSILVPATDATGGVSNIFLEITAVNPTANPATVTVRNNTTAQQTLAIGVKGIPFTARAWDNCGCPSSLHTGSKPALFEDVDFIAIQDKKQFCGDELEECERNRIQYSGIDENGNNVINEGYVPDVLMNFERDYERAIQLKVMHNNEPNKKGIIPQLKDKAIRWTTNSSTEVTLNDLEELIGKFKENGVKCKTFEIKASFNKFKQYQLLARTLAEGKIVFGGCGERINEFCNSIDLKFCTISHLDYTFFIMEEECFTNTQGYGALGTYANSALICPMEKRNSVQNTRYKYDMKTGNDGMGMGTLVYKRTKNGRVYDRYTEETGYGTARNLNQAGCKDMFVSKETFVAVEIYQAKCWVLQDFN